MQSRPPDLSDATLAAAISQGWGIGPTTVTYQPVGYGSHHWSAEDGRGGRWFTSVDVLEQADPEASLHRLRAALVVAVTARAAGLAYVVAPVPATDGSVLRRLPGGYALAVYPHVDGKPGGFGDGLAPAESTELTGMLCALHDLPPSVASGIGTEAFAIPDRTGLEAALPETNAEWSGPFGERLRRLLTRHAVSIGEVLAEHDRLVSGSAARRDRFVITHGEPHPGNLMRTSEGLLLIDWETALLAPPERDVWLLDARSGEGTADDYTARCGRPLDPGLLSRYRLAWALADVALFVDLLRTTSDETDDTAWSWEALRGTLEELSTARESAARGEA
jgi:spectinomycin phosphotransferase